MQLTKIEFRKSDLQKIPDLERTLFICLAHAANELNVLSKLFQISITPPTTELERKSMVVQGLLLGRLLTGKLYEVWQLFGSAFFATKISAIYEPLFDKESQEAFLELKRYFGKSNLISTVRNKHAFHYSVEQIPAGFAKLVEDIPLDIYISEFNSNTMYAFADDILNTAMLESIVPGDHHKAMESYMEETSKVSGLFATVLGRCMAIAIQKYLNVEFSAQHHSNVSINNASKWDEVKIPFFIESPKYFSFSLELGGELEWGETSMMSPDLLSTKTKN